MNELFADEHSVWWLVRWQPDTYGETGRPMRHFNSLGEARRKLDSRGVVYSMRISQNYPANKADVKLGRRAD